MRPEFLRKQPTVNAAAEWLNAHLVQSAVRDAWALSSNVKTAVTVGDSSFRPNDLIIMIHTLMSNSGRPRDELCFWVLNLQNAEKILPTGIRVRGEGGDPGSQMTTLATFHASA